MTPHFAALLERWGTVLRPRCAYAPSGNGIAERSHRTVKRIAARKECSIEEALYWYNVSPKDNSEPGTAPINCIHSYAVRVMGEASEAPSTPAEVGDFRPMFAVGDRVWVKPDGARCNTRFRLGTVTGVLSHQAIEVDGMPRHVRDLRPASIEDEDSEEQLLEEREPEIAEWDPGDVLLDSVGTPDEEHGYVPPREPRRSARNIRPPDRLGVQPWL